MLSFFCRARSDLKQSQGIESKAKPVRLVGSIHSLEAKDLCGNHPAGKADNQGELIWLRSHQVNRDNSGDDGNGHQTDD